MILNTSIIPMQFLPTPSARRATARKPRAGARRAYFYPRPPRGGRLMSFCVVSQSFHISTHALREEGDIRCLQTSERWPSYFYPRPPRGGRPDIVAIIQSHKEISTHALREEGDTDKTCSLHRRCRISTHALREEGDEVLPGDTISCDLFLPTPSARRATALALVCDSIFIFLPTPSARRATCTCAAASVRRADFYPRPPRGGRQTHADPTLSDLRISTHALREEGDPNKSGDPSNVYGFLPTPSARRATRTKAETQATYTDFYPRPPRGGRLLHNRLLQVLVSISTHALREEGDNLR